MDGEWMYEWIDSCMDGYVEVWLDGSRVIEAVVNLTRTINIHFWDALECFFLSSI
jgi:threonine aldolase